MSGPQEFKINEETDLVLERVIDVSPERVWAAWTTPELLLKWFVPKPWSLAECRVDLRPGGEFYSLMRSPEGELVPAGSGCILEVVQNRRLIWTDALGPGYRPAPEPFFTGAILIDPEGAGTQYRAIAMHRDAETRSKHAEMGFHQGWGAALDQLVELMK